jgi:Family of unknown function (DUF1028)
MAACTPGTDTYYAIQGNILASHAVVTDAMEAFAKAPGELTDRVMAAMEAADARGGDKRCTCETAPKVNAPSQGKTAHVAYILLASPPIRWRHAGGGHPRDVHPRHRPGHQPSGERQPLKTLRPRSDRWKSR